MHIATGESTIARWRNGLALWLPGLIAAVLVLLQSKKPPEARIMSAMAAAIAVEVVTGVAALLCAVLAAKLLRQGDPLAVASGANRTSLLASMLVGTLVWAAWQINREQTVIELANCAERAVTQDLLGPRAAVLECWRNRESEDNGE